MRRLIFSDGIFDLNEALVRIAVMIIVPLGIVAACFAIYAVSKSRKK